jgi:hypothetical protein
LTKKLDYDGGECLERKNDRQYIMEFKSYVNANNFVTQCDLSLIKAKAYIPPSFVEITGMPIRGVPTEYSDEEILANIKTYGENTKINHVRRFIRVSADGKKEAMETVAIHFQTQSLPRQVRLFGGLVFHVQPYKKSPLRCKRCLHFGHSAKLCKHTMPICRICAGSHLTEECPTVQQGAINNPKCLHCKGPHNGDSIDCPKYQELTKIIEANPFPNLYNQTSLAKVLPPLKPLHSAPSGVVISNRFDALQIEEADPEIEM